MKNSLIILQILLLCAVSLTLGFISCGEAAPDLSTYRGINYIENYKFRSFPVGLSGGWSFDDTVAPNNHHYMGFNSDETGAEALPTGISLIGLPGGAADDISRLEIFNLVIDGGFEESTRSPAWTWTDPNADIDHKNGALPPHYIANATGNCFYYHFDATPPPNAEINFDLGSVKDTFLENKKYTIRLKFFKERSLSITKFKFNDERGWDVRAEREWTGMIGGYTKFPDAYADNSEVVARSPISGNTFRIIHDNHNVEGYIDDLRVVRSDIDYYLSFTVPYSDAGRPNLQPGTYRFSVWFKAEETTDVSPNEDRFNSSRVSLGIGKPPSVATVTGFDSSLISGTWRQLSVQKFIQIRDGDELLLLISPADKTSGSNTIDVGSVLIAYPELYYISE
ncbi:MAG: hypothetical protein FWF38_01035 [Spirochaetaceae bacterium]|nr:hypothetical protein [Spirochaetaceae bacterium]